MAFLLLLGKILSNPLVMNVVVPSVANALARLLDRQAERVELKSAVRAVKASKTAEELRNASIRLGESLRSK